jgi:hypothetical protein
MGSVVNIKQNTFSHGMQSETRNKDLVGQTQVFGASMVKNYDIYSDKNKLVPNPTFERFNTDAESDYKILSLGGDDGDIVYGVGNGVSNWYNLSYNRRALITPSAISDISYGVFNLANLGADFWDNVSADGSDIAFVEADTNNSMQMNLANFDKDLEEGYVMYKLGTLKNFYIYWESEFGNPNTGVEGITSGKTDHFYTVMGEDFAGTFDLDPSANSVTPSDGIYGFQFKGTSDSDGINTTSGTEEFLQFMYKMDSSPSGTTNISFVNSAFEIDIDSSGQISLIVDPPSAGPVTFNASGTLSSNTWYHIQATIKDGSYVAIYVNGVEVLNTVVAYGIDSQLGDVIISASNGVIGNLCVGLDKSLELARMETEGLMHGTINTFYAIGSTELLSSITLTFDGHALYQKSIDASEWRMVANNSNSDQFPTTGFVVVDSGKWYYLTSESGIGQKPNVHNTYDTIDLFESTVYDPASFNGDFSSPQVSFPIDKEYYFQTGGTVSNISGGAFNMEVYDPYPQPTSMVEYGYSLAIVGTRREQAYIEIWDTTNLDPETVVRLGTGNAEVITNIKGNLVTVVDNYIQSENLSKNDPSLDFRVWQGSDNVKNLQSFKYDVVDTVYTYPFQQTIGNVRSDLNNLSVFYAEPNSESTGMWGIGMSEKTTDVGVSIPYGVSNLARPLNHISKGNNLIVIDQNFDIWKLSSANYSEQSIFETMVIDAGLPGRKKDIVGIEITLDKAPSEAQTITLSYSVDNGSYETIGTCSDKVTEFTLASGESFNNFDECKLKITSTGGDASIVEWSMKVEYEEEVV